MIILDDFFHRGPLCRGHAPSGARTDPSGSAGDSNPTRHRRFSLDSSFPFLGIRGSAPVIGMQIVSDGPGTHQKKAPLVRISQPQADGWGVRRSLRERTHAHADEISYFVPSPPPTFFIRQTLISPISLRQSCSISLSFPFPFKGNVMEPTPGFNKKTVRRSRN